MKESYRNPDPGGRMYRDTGGDHKQSSLCSATEQTASACVPLSQHISFKYSTLKHDDLHSFFVHADSSPSPRKDSYSFERKFPVSVPTSSIPTASPSTRSGSGNGFQRLDDLSNMASSNIGSEKFLPNSGTSVSMVGEGRSDFVSCSLAELGVCLCKHLVGDFLLPNSGEVTKEKRRIDDGSYPVRRLEIFYPENPATLVLRGSLSNGLACANVPLNNKRCLAKDKSVNEFIEENIENCSKAVLSHAFTVGSEDDQSMRPNKEFMKNEKQIKDSLFLLRRSSTVSVDGSIAAVESTKQSDALIGCLRNMPSMSCRCPLCMPMSCNEGIFSIGNGPPACVNPGETMDCGVSAGNEISNEIKDEISGLPMFRFLENKTFCYEALQCLGSGISGTVYECLQHEVDNRSKGKWLRRRVVALKIFRCTHECICAALNELFVRFVVLCHHAGDQRIESVDKSMPMMRPLDFFVYRRHICMALPLLFTDVYQLLKKCKFRGLPLFIVQQIASQMVQILGDISKAKVAHFDLKPENMLLQLLLAKKKEPKLMHGAATNTISIEGNDYNSTTILNEGEVNQGDQCQETEQVHEQKGNSENDANKNDYQNKKDSRVFVFENGSRFCTPSTPTDGLNCEDSDDQALQSCEYECGELSVSVRAIDFSSARVWLHKVYPHPENAEQHADIVKQFLKECKSMVCYRLQTRYYGAPELLLGIPYYASTDIWSLGCVLAELFIGVPLYPARTHFQLLKLITTMVGSPSRWMLDNGSRVWKFYKRIPKVSLDGGQAEMQSLKTRVDSVTWVKPECFTEDGAGSSSSQEETIYNETAQSERSGNEVTEWQMLSTEEYEMKHNNGAHCVRLGKDGDEYYSTSSDQVFKCTNGPNSFGNKTECKQVNSFSSCLSNADLDKESEGENCCFKSAACSETSCTMWRCRREKKMKENFIDFLEKVLVFDPLIRLSVEEAAKHPFITEAPDVDPDNEYYASEWQKRQLEFALKSREKHFEEIVAAKLGRRTSRGRKQRQCEVSRHDMVFRQENLVGIHSNLLLKSVHMEAKSDSASENEKIDEIRVQVAREHRAEKANGQFQPMKETSSYRQLPLASCSFNGYPVRNPYGGTGKTQWRNGVEYAGLRILRSIKGDDDMELAKSQQLNLPVNFHYEQSTSGTPVSAPNDCCFGLREIEAVEVNSLGASTWNPATLRTHCESIAASSRVQICESPLAVNQIYNMHQIPNGTIPSNSSEKCNTLQSEFFQNNANSRLAFSCAFPGAGGPLMNPNPVKRGDEMFSLWLSFNRGVKDCNWPREHELAHVNSNESMNPGRGHGMTPRMRFPVGNNVITPERGTTRAPLFVNGAYSALPYHDEFDNSFLENFADLSLDAAAEPDVNDAISFDGRGCNIENPHMRRYNTHRLETEGPTDISYPSFKRLMASPQPESTLPSVYIHAALRLIDPPMGSRRVLYRRGMEAHIQNFTTYADGNNAEAAPYRLDRQFVSASHSFDPKSACKFRKKRCSRKNYRRDAQNPFKS